MKYLQFLLIMLLSISLVGCNSTMKTMNIDKTLDDTISPNKELALKVGEIDVEAISLGAFWIIWYAAAAVKAYSNASRESIAKEIILKELNNNHTNIKVDDNNSKYTVNFTFNSVQESDYNFIANIRVQNTETLEDVFEKDYKAFPSKRVNDKNELLASSFSNAVKQFLYDPDALQAMNAYGIIDENNPNNRVSKLKVSTGTGFYISEDGYLLTNAHVVKKAKNIMIHQGHERLLAELISLDIANDIAILKVNKTVKPLPILDNELAKVGSDVSVIGYPMIGIQGNEKKATFGYVNSLSGLQGDKRFYQISAPIQPGNSGSPLINDDGEVVGIVTSTINQEAAYKATGSLAQNVNWAVKIAYAQPLLLEKQVKYNRLSTKKKLLKSELFEQVEDSVVLIVAE